MVPPRRSRVLAVAVACLTLVLPACHGPERRQDALLVLAASSLADAFTAVGRAFEAAHDGVTVRFAFAGSQQLASQVLDGAPADVFASADSAQMAAVVAADAVDDGPRPFASNRLTIAVEPGNPLGITGVDDLTDPGVTLVLAATEVPAGRYARQVLDAAGIRAVPDSLETDVRAVLSKVVLGEADAGIVYTSDVVAAEGEVAQVAIPHHHNVTATYPIATLADAPSPDLAADFVAFVRSEPGQSLLVEHGFTGSG